MNIWRPPGKLCVSVTFDTNFCYRVLLQLPECTDQAVVKLLKKLMSAGDADQFNLKRIVESLEELVARTFGLPSNADLEVIADVSR